MLYAHTVAVYKTASLKNIIDSMLIFTGIFFYLNALSAIMIYFSKSLPYSTSNAQLSEEPLEKPNYGDKNSAKRYSF